VKCDGCGRTTGTLCWAGGGVELCRQCNEKWQIVSRANVVISLELAGRLRDLANAWGAEYWPNEEYEHQLRTDVKELTHLINAAKGDAE
jgi:hypothetical protein